MPHWRESGNQYNWPSDGKLIWTDRPENYAEFGPPRYKMMGK